MNSENLPGVIAAAAIAIVATSMVALVPQVQNENPGIQDTKTAASTDASSMQQQTAQNGISQQKDTPSYDSNPQPQVANAKQKPLADNSVAQSKYNANTNSKHTKTTNPDKPSQSSGSSVLSQVDIPSAPEKNTADSTKTNLQNTAPTTISLDKPTPDKKQTLQQESNSLSDRLQNDNAAEHAKRGKIVASSGKLDVTVYNVRSLEQGWKTVTFRVYNDSSQPQVANLKVESDDSKTKYSHAGGVYPNSYKEAGLIMRSDNMDSLKVTIMQ